MKSVLDEIVDLHAKGAKLLFAHGHSGKPKIKVHYGFLHLRTKRYVVDSATMSAIKDEILLHRKH